MLSKHFSGRKFCRKYYAGAKISNITCTFVYLVEVFLQTLSTGLFDMYGDFQTNFASLFAFQILNKCRLPLKNK